jgi:3-methylfumaryl-CoA hydratase
MSWVDPLESAVSEWTPGVERASVVMGATTAEVLADVLDSRRPRLADGDALPPLWHWPYFSTPSSLVALGADGHPDEGVHYPPIPDRRRMFVGGRLTVHRDLKVGWAASVEGEIVDRTIKRGRSGEMLFVTVRRTFTQSDDVCLVEEQDIMYRSGDATGRTGADPVGMGDSTAHLHDEPTFTSTKLFAFSAITSNAHRIHYDLEYARRDEGYPGVVVHGPLLVLTMLELARVAAGERRVATVTYRLRNPVILGDDVRTEAQTTGDSVDLVMRSSRHDIVASAAVALR